MTDRKMLVIFGLILVIVAITVFTLGKVGQVSLLQTEKIGLEEDRKSLNAKLENMSKENKTLKDKFANFDDNLAKLDASKNEIQKRFENVLKEKEDLKSEIRKLSKELASEKGRIITAQSAMRNPEADVEDKLIGVERDTYWAGILKNNAELGLEVETLRADLDALKLTNEKLSQEKNRLSMEFKNQNRDSRDFERQLMYNNQVLDSLTQELFREKSDKFTIEANRNSLETDNNLLKEQLKNLDSRKVELEKKFAELQAKNKVMENNLVRMVVFVRQKVLQMDNLKAELGILQQGKAVSPLIEEPTKPASEPKKESVQLQPIVVRPQESAKGKYAPVVVTTKKAEVLAINSDNNFVIINLGESSGIKVGDRFSAYNKSKDITNDIEVIQVRKNIAACDIKTPDYYIEVGDAIK